MLKQGGPSYAAFPYVGYRVVRVFDADRVLVPFVLNVGATLS